MKITALLKTSEFEVKLCEEQNAKEGGQHEKCEQLVLALAALLFISTRTLTRKILCARFRDRLRPCLEFLVVA